MTDYTQSHPLQESAALAAWAQQMSLLPLSGWLLLVAKFSGILKVSKLFWFPCFSLIVCSVCVSLSLGTLDSSHGFLSILAVVSFLFLLAPKIALGRFGSFFLN